MVPENTQMWERLVVRDRETKYNPKPLKVTSFMEIHVSYLCALWTKFWLYLIKMTPPFSNDIKPLSLWDAPFYAFDLLLHNKSNKSCFDSVTLCTWLGLLAYNIGTWFEQASTITFTEPWNSAKVSKTGMNRWSSIQQIAMQSLKNLTWIVFKIKPVSWPFFFFFF